MLEVGRLLTEGKGKKVYATANPDEAVVFFKDEAMAFHGLKRGRILGKGEVNNAICEHMFRYLAANGIANHYIRPVDARQSLVKRVDMLPVAVKVRNVVAGTLVRRLNMPLGTKLDPVVLEFVYKGNEDEPLVNSTHIRAMGIATEEEIVEMKRLSLRVNELLKALTQEMRVELIDFQLGFGRFHGQLMLADEITPDVARFWDANTHEPLDLDLFRRDLGDPAQGYRELLHRMMGLDENGERV